MPTGTTASTWFQTTVAEPVTALRDQIMAFLPTLLGALLILIIGWLIAQAIQGIVVRVLKTVGLDKLADQVQLSNVLAKGGVRARVSELIGAIVYWLVMLAVVMVVFNALQLTVAAELFQSIVAFLPNVIAALFILIVGIFAAAFLSATMRTAASNAGLSQPQLIGQLVQTIVVIFAAVAALQQLRIPFFGEVFLIILAGISLGSALAFGLGCKDQAGRWVSGLVDQLSSRKR